jgi:hypothetical protein
LVLASKEDLFPNTFLDEFIEPSFFIFIEDFFFFSDFEFFFSFGVVAAFGLKY